MSSVFDTLKERGFIQQCSNEDGLRKTLESGRISYYVGFDPTGTSLHVGHLVPLMAMAHLQRAGHRPVALVGSGTARIGDPSGKSETRQMLTIERIEKNSINFRQQITRFLDFSAGQALMVDNTQWLANLNYIDFLREIGKHFSVNRMLSFEAYRQRLEKGLSFIEFNYQLLQSYDYLILNRDYDCILQMGGDDQWGNIVSGMELIRRIKGSEVFALTSPLLTRADGQKMGKTEKGALYLDAGLVSPYEFYQYWINVPDEDVGNLLRLLTFLPIAEIDQLSLLKGRELNRAKEVLAYEITGTVHGKPAADEVRRTSQAAFQERESQDLSAIPATELSSGQLKGGVGIIELFTLAGLCQSKSEARRLILQGGAYVNGSNIGDLDSRIGPPDIRDGMIILRAGKKRYGRIIVVE